MKALSRSIRIIAFSYWIIYLLLDVGAVRYFLDFLFIFFLAFLHPFLKFKDISLMFLVSSLESWFSFVFIESESLRSLMLMIFGRIYGNSTVLAGLIDSSLLVSIYSIGLLNFIWLWLSYCSVLYWFRKTKLRERIGIF